MVCIVIVPILLNDDDDTVTTSNIKIKSCIIHSPCVR